MENDSLKGLVFFDLILHVFVTLIYIVEERKKFHQKVENFLNDSLFMYGEGEMKSLLFNSIFRVEVCNNSLFFFIINRICKK